MRANDSDSLTMRVAEEIRVALVRRRMSARQLASQVDLSQSAMSARLTGTTPIRLDELEKIANALGLDSVAMIHAAVNRDGITTYSMGDATQTMRDRQVTEPQVAERMTPARPTATVPVRHAPDVSSRASRTGASRGRVARPSWTHERVTT